MALIRRYPRPNGRLLADSSRAESGAGHASGFHRPRLADAFATLFPVIAMNLYLPLVYQTRRMRSIPVDYPGRPLRLAPQALAVWPCATRLARVRVKIKPRGAVVALGICHN
jgi:hypothetical protein